MIEWNEGMAETMRQISDTFDATDDGIGSPMAFAVAAYREIERLNADLRLPHDCLDAARKLSTQHGGMASIRFMYDPYDADWVARADWSDAAFYEASGETPRDAWKNLLGKLNAAKAGKEGDA